MKCHGESSHTALTYAPGSPALPLWESAQSAPPTHTHPPVVCGPLPPPPPQIRLPLRFLEWRTTMEPRAGSDGRQNSRPSTLVRRGPNLQSSQGKTKVCFVYENFQNSYILSCLWTFKCTHYSNGRPAHCVLVRGGCLSWFQQSIWQCPCGLAKRWHRDELQLVKPQQWCDNVLGKS